MNAEKYPQCGKLTLEVVPTIGRKIIGDTKKCSNSNCNFSVLPQKPDTVKKLNKKIKRIKNEFVISFFRSNRNSNYGDIKND